MHISGNKARRFDGEDHFASHLAVPYVLDGTETHDEVNDRAGRMNWDHFSEEGLRGLDISKLEGVTLILDDTLPDYEDSTAHANQFGDLLGFKVKPEQTTDFGRIEGTI